MELEAFAAALASSPPSAWGAEDRALLLLRTTGVLLQAGAAAVPLVSMTCFERHHLALNKAIVTVGAVTRALAACCARLPQRHASLLADVLLYLVHQDELDDYMPQVVAMVALHGAVPLANCLTAAAAPAGAVPPPSGAAAAAAAAVRDPEAELLGSLAVLLAAAAAHRAYRALVGEKEQDLVAQRGHARGAARGDAASGIGGGATPARGSGRPRGSQSVLGSPPREKPGAACSSGSPLRGHSTPRPWATTLPHHNHVIHHHRHQQQSQPHHQPQRHGGGSSSSSGTGGGGGSAAAAAEPSPLWSLSRAFGWRLAAVAVLHGQALCATVADRYGAGSGAAHGDVAVALAAQSLAVLALAAGAMLALRRVPAATGSCWCNASFLSFTGFAFTVLARGISLSHLSASSGAVAASAATATPGSVTLGGAVGASLCRSLAVVTLTLLSISDSRAAVAAQLTASTVMLHAAALYGGASASAAAGALPAAATIVRRMLAAAPASPLTIYLLSPLAAAALPAVCVPTWVSTPDTAAGSAAVAVAAGSCSLPPSPSGSAIFSNGHSQSHLQPPQRQPQMPYFYAADAHWSRGGLRRGGNSGPWLGPRQRPSSSCPGTEAAAAAAATAAAGRCQPGARDPSGCMPAPRAAVACVDGAAAGAASCCGSGSGVGVSGDVSGASAGVVSGRGSGSGVSVGVSGSSSGIAIIRRVATPLATAAAVPSAPGAPGTWYLGKRGGTAGLDTVEPGARGGGGGVSGRRGAIPRHNSVIDLPPLPLPPLRIARVVATPRRADGDEGGSKSLTEAPLAATCSEPAATARTTAGAGAAAEARSGVGHPRGASGGCGGGGAEEERGAPEATTGMASHTEPASSAALAAMLAAAWDVTAAASASAGEAGSAADATGADAERGPLLEGPGPLLPAIGAGRPDPGSCRQHETLRGRSGSDGSGSAGSASSGRRGGASSVAALNGDWYGEEEDQVTQLVQELYGHRSVQPASYGSGGGRPPPPPLPPPVAVDAVPRCASWSSSHGGGVKGSGVIAVGTSGSAGGGTLPWATFDGDGGACRTASAPSLTPSRPPRSPFAPPLQQQQQQQQQRNGRPGASGLPGSPPAPQADCPPSSPTLRIADADAASAAAGAAAAAAKAAAEVAAAAAASAAAEAKAALAKASLGSRAAAAAAAAAAKLAAVWTPPPAAGAPPPPPATEAGAVAKPVYAHWSAHRALSARTLSCHGPSASLAKSVADAATRLPPGRASSLLTRSFLSYWRTSSLRAIPRGAHSGSQPNHVDSPWTPSSAADSPVARCDDGAGGRRTTDGGLFPAAGGAGGADPWFTSGLGAALPYVAPVIPAKQPRTTTTTLKALDASKVFRSHKALFRSLGGSGGSGDGSPPCPCRAGGAASGGCGPSASGGTSAPGALHDGEPMEQPSLRCRVALTGGGCGGTVTGLLPTPLAPPSKPGTPHTGAGTPHVVATPRTSATSPRQRQEEAWTGGAAAAQAAARLGLEGLTWDTRAVAATPSLMSGMLQSSFTAAALERPMGRASPSPVSAVSAAGRDAAVDGPPTPGAAGSGAGSGGAASGSGGSFSGTWPLPYCRSRQASYAGCEDVFRANTSGPAPVLPPLGRSASAGCDAAAAAAAAAAVAGAAEPVPTASQAEDERTLGEHQFWIALEVPMVLANTHKVMQSLLTPPPPSRPPPSPLPPLDNPAATVGATPTPTSLYGTLLPAAAVGLYCTACLMHAAALFSNRWAAAAHRRRHLLHGGRQLVCRLLLHAALAAGGREHCVTPLRAWSLVGSLWALLGLRQRLFLQLFPLMAAAYYAVHELHHWHISTPYGRLYDLMRFHLDPLLSYLITGAAVLGLTRLLRRLRSTGLGRRLLASARVLPEPSRLAQAVLCVAIALQFVPQLISKQTGLLSWLAGQLERLGLGGMLGLLTSASWAAPSPSPPTQGSAGQQHQSDLAVAAVVLLFLAVSVLQSLVMRLPFLHSPRYAWYSRQHVKVLSFMDAVMLSDQSVASILAAFRAATAEAFAGCAVNVALLVTDDPVADVEYGGGGTVGGGGSGGGEPPLLAAAGASVALHRVHEGAMVPTHGSRARSGGAAAAATNAFAADGAAAAASAAVAEGEAEEDGDGAADATEAAAPSAIRRRRRRQAVRWLPLNALESIAYATSQRLIVFTNDYATSSLLFQDWAVLHRSGGGVAMTVVPLVFNGRDLGALEIVSPWPDVFDEQMRRIVVEFATQLGQALYNKVVEDEASVGHRLLLEIMPSAVAEQVKRQVLQRGLNEATPHQALPPTASETIVYKHWHPQVSVLFADVLGYTRLSCEVEPEVVMLLLHVLFSKLDALCAQYGCYKVNTIGDCYIACTGLLVEVEDHAQQLVDFGRALLRACSEVDNPLGGKIEMRVGINSGRVMSGIVGKTRPHFTVYGDCVNTASRMESTGFPGTIQITEETYLQLGEAERALWGERGSVQVKGKGAMTTYVLLNESGSAALAGEAAAAAAATAVASASRSGSAVSASACTSASVALWEGPPLDSSHVEGWEFAWEI